MSIIYSSIKCINKDGIDDELVVLNNNIGSVYMQLEKYELAIKYYERCMKLKPSIGNEAAYNIALCYKKTNNLLASLKWFEKDVYINSKDDIAYCNILEIAIKEGKIDTYEKYLLMAIYNNLSSNIIKWCEYTLEQEFFRYRLPLLHQIYINLMEVNLERLQEDKSKVLMIIKNLRKWIFKK